MDRLQSGQSRSAEIGRALSTCWAPTQGVKVAAWTHHRPPATRHYTNPRFPVEIISHAVWLYFRFCPNFREVEELLLERGVVVTYEAIRKWCRKSGQQYEVISKIGNLA
jgi:hypothetical protein